MRHRISTRFGACSKRGARRRSDPDCHRWQERATSWSCWETIGIAVTVSPVGAAPQARRAEHPAQTEQQRAVAVAQRQSGASTIVDRATTAPPCAGTMRSHPERPRSRPRSSRRLTRGVAGVTLDEIVHVATPVPHRTAHFDVTAALPVLRSRSTVRREQRRIPAYSTPVKSSSSSSTLAPSVRSAIRRLVTELSLDGFDLRCGVRWISWRARCPARTGRASQDERGETLPPLYGSVQEYPRMTLLEDLISPGL